MSVELRLHPLIAVSRFLPLLAVLCLSACGGGGGGGGGDAAPAATTGGGNNNPPGSSGTGTTTSSAIPATPNNNAAVTACPTVPAANAGAASTTAALAGRITFDRISFYPAAASYAAFDPTRSGLDYANPQVLPARGVIVEAVAASGSSCEGNVLDTTVTDGDGWYAFNVDPDQTVCVRTRAQLYRTDSAGANWNISVVDNTDGNRLYAMADSRFATARSQPRRNLHAASGWSGGGYTVARVAAPFAILDTACKSVNAVLAAQPGAQFGDMQFRWSTRNTESLSGSPTEGKIGGAYYSATAKAVYLRGDAQTNTDEFDEMVVTHEFGHFMTHRFSRADSVGGDHSLQDYLDPRVAFDEGWATAFAGLVLQSRVYRDSDEVSTPSAQSREYFFYIDDSSVWRRSWYSEASVQSLIYTFGETAGSDGVGVGFGGIWQVFFNPAYKNGAALQTIFSFASTLKAANPADAAAISQRLQTEQISGYTIDAFAQGETNAPDTARDLPVYKTLTMAATQSVCSSNFYGVAPRASTGGDNKLSRIRYLSFTAPQSGNFRITATPQTSGSTGGLAGLQILDAGRYIACSGSNSYIESLVAGAAQSLTCPLQGKTYVVAVYQTDFSNNTSAAAGNVDQCFTVKAEPQ